jgi:hypothetical protein
METAVKYCVEVFMSKKIALVLIMAILVNCIAWADDDVNTILIATGIAVGAGLIAALIIIGVTVAVTEADQPEDGLRLASLSSSSPVSETGFGPVLNILQHVDVGVTPENKAYVGLRFQF